MTAERDFVDRLARERIRRGFTQAEVAKRIPIAKPAISMLESGHRGFKLQVLLAYAAAIGVTITITAHTDA